MGALAHREPTLDVERARVLLRESRDIDEILSIRDAAKLVVEWRRMQGETVELINEAQELVLRAQRRFGEFLRGAELERGRPRKADGRLRLQDIGATRTESSRCQRLALIPEALFEQHLVAVQAAGKKLTLVGALSLSLGHHDADEWVSPPELVDAARRVMGALDLDPASSEAAQRVVRADRFYTLADDGLGHSWAGRVWLAAPNSQPLVERFVEKLAGEFAAGRVVQALALQNASTYADWFQSLAALAHVCLIDGRLEHRDEDGARMLKGNPQAVFYLGEAPDRFEAVFGAFGVVGRLKRTGAA